MRKCEKRASRIRRFLLHGPDLVSDCEAKFACVPRPEEKWSGHVFENVESYGETGVSDLCICGHATYAASPSADAGYSDGGVRFNVESEFACE